MNPLCKIICFFKNHLFILIPFIGIGEIDLHNKTHFKCFSWLLHHLNTIDVFILVITFRTLYFKIVDNVLFNFRFTFIPYIWTKDRHQHTTVDANREQNNKWKEENHSYWICTTGHHKTFISGIVVAYVKQCQKSSFISTELPSFSTK